MPQSLSKFDSVPSEVTVHSAPSSAVPLPPQAAVNVRVLVVGLPPLAAFTVMSNVSVLLMPSSVYCYSLISGRGDLCGKVGGS